MMEPSSIFLFSLVSPSPHLYARFDVSQIVKDTPFYPLKGWGGSKIGLFWGGVTVQGLLPYYYEVRVDAFSSLS